MVRNQTSRGQPKKSSPSSGSDGQWLRSMSQESEYENLLLRVESRKDATEIKKIAKQIEREP
jgi:hypothetical protein